jgi:CDP-glycerol glycerophosphotransferase (TagB/SpsB family)
MRRGELAFANILVRPHLGYRGDADRFTTLEDEGKVVVDKSDKQNHKLRDHYDTSIDHVYNLFNSLYHADVCVNSASTLSLDAVACGTEVVNFNFDAGPVSRKNNSIKRLFVSDYVRELMDADGTWLVKNKKEFIDALKGILEKGEQKDSKKMINTFMYKTEGKSAERITDVLIRIANQG